MNNIQNGNRQSCLDERQNVLKKRILGPVATTRLLGKISWMREPSPTHKTSTNVLRQRVKELKFRENAAFISHTSCLRTELKGSVKKLLI